ncbi:MAG: cellulase family glycosylhydrolase [Pirellulaceae bacterium]|nr:cellulase family glycosylhydrolase [Pirellulaceae bacterium]
MDTCQRKPSLNRTCAVFLIVALALVSQGASVQALERIGVAGRELVTESGKPFHPWGFNYGNAGRLMEDFWNEDWQTIADDFREMKQLGANVVRVHLQVGKFMNSATEMNPQAMQQFVRLIKLAEATELYLDVTGLASYRPADRPAWYDAMTEDQRWQTQAFFWRAIATEGAKSNAVFCYDLMNEPLSPSGEGGSWYSGNLFGGYDFLQKISTSLGNRTRGEVALQWIDRLRAEIKAVDTRALVTVGMLPWVTKWGHLSGMVPAEVAGHVDFLCVHIYPKTKEPDEAVKAIEFCRGKVPVVVEETFPLSCSIEELESFMKSSRSIATGWIWHYDGTTLEEYAELEKAGKLTLPMAIYRTALQSFVRLTAEFR